MKRNNDSLYWQVTAALHSAACRTVHFLVADCIISAQLHYQPAAIAMQRCRTLPMLQNIQLYGFGVMFNGLGLVGM